MTTKKSLSATQKALSASSAFPVYRDTMSGRLVCGSSLSAYLRDMFGGSLCVSDYVTAGMLATVDTSFPRAVSLAARVLDFCDAYEIRDIYESDLQAVAETAAVLYAAKDGASCILEWVCDLYGETENGADLVRLMDDLRLFIQARRLQDASEK